MSSKSTGSEVATIEQMESRQSPRIKRFIHFDLGITRTSMTSDSNPAYSAKRVISPPGAVQIGGVIPPIGGSYYPEVEFIAVANHKYLLTWICVPFPYVAVVETESEKIVGVDSYCPNCKILLGTTLSSDNECVDSYMHPPRLKFDENALWADGHRAWNDESSRQSLRDLCRAAELGVTSAMMAVAFEYKYGGAGHYFPQDNVRAYQWYRRAAQSERPQGTSFVKSFEDEILSPQQLEEAIRTLDAYETGQCENDIEFLRSHPQIYTVPSLQ